MPTLIDTLRETFGAERLATDEATRLVYGYDNSRRESMPDAVVSLVEATWKKDIAAGN